MDKQRSEYYYADAGFNRFFSRSIADNDSSIQTLSQRSRMATQQVRSINFDQQNVGGNMSGVMNIDKIELNGQEGNISIRDDRNEVRAFMGASSE